MNHKMSTMPNWRSRRRRNSSSDSSDSGCYNIREARCEAHRKKIGIKLSKQLDGCALDLTEQRQEELVQYNRNTFMMKECIWYSPKTGAGGDKSPTKPVDYKQETPCYCGETFDKHFAVLASLATPVSSARQSFSHSPRSANNIPQDVQQKDNTAGLGARTNVVHPIASPKRLEPMEMTGSTKSTVVLPPILTNRNVPSLHFEEPQTWKADKGVGNDPSANHKPTPGVMIMGSPSRSLMAEWNSSAAFKEFPTNAFGKIEFANDEARTKPAKYVRLSNTTSVSTVLELMVNKWKMLEPHRPSLAISVIGGAKNFSLDGRKKDIFSNGLVKAAQATNAWILTSGCYMGIMKTVGEAVRDSQTLQLQHSRVTHSLRCVGIAPWGYVHSREDLVDKNGMGCWPATYHVDPVVRHGKPVSLDPNHTHYVLVDDGFRNMFRPQVADFRASLERHIAAKETGMGETNFEAGLGIPVVVVLVEGGLDSLDFAYESIKHHIPLVLCQGTGRAADIFSYAYNHHVIEQDEEGNTSRYLPERHREIVLEKLKAAYGKTLKSSKKMQNERFGEKLKQILKCCKQEEMITVFDINRNEDFDLAILSALLKGRGASRLDQLKLALKWNRSDVAADKLFVDSAIWEEGQLDDIMTEALASNKADFVKLLLQHGVVMKDYLTVRRLRALYNNAGRGSFLRTMLFHVAGQQDRFFLHHVKHVLERLLERPVEMVYSLDEEEAAMISKAREMTRSEELMHPVSESRFNKPFKELFLWALLMHRPQLARFFWERGDHPVINALMATKVYDSLSRIVSEQNSDLHREYRAFKKEFENLAISVLEYAFLVDPEKALLIVERPNMNLNRTTCLEMASAAQDRKFLASPCCQTSIDQVWKRGLAASGFEVVLGLFCPPYVVARMRFDKASIGIDHKNMGPCQKLKTFYSAPITKFCSFTLFYALFLLLYTYVLLFDFRPQWTIPEAVLHMWVGTILLTSIRDWTRAYLQFYRRLDDGRRAGNSLGVAFMSSSIWSKMEVAGLACHAVGMALRWLPEDHFDITRVAFCVAVVLFYLRIFRVYMASSYLGPKLFIIRRMFKDVAMFLMILVVVMLAYAVASQALMYPTRDFYWGIFTDILYYPYWQIYGELALDNTIAGNRDGCEGNMTMNARGQHCPRKYWPVALMLAVYLLVGNILLVNLLIAIFTHVFEEVQANSTEIWKYELYGLSVEFDHKPILPPPFTFLETVYSVLKWIVCQKWKQDNKNFMPLSKKQKENLQIFEKECMNEYLRSVEAAKRHEMGNQVAEIKDRVNGLFKKWEDERKMQMQLEALNSFSRNSTGRASVPGSTAPTTAHSSVDIAETAAKQKFMKVLTRSESSVQCDLLSDNYEQLVEDDKRQKSSKHSHLENKKLLEQIQEKIVQLEMKARQLSKDSNDSYD